MNTDYRKLCIDLFGTDNVEELKKIAQKVNNNRNAGRKRKLLDNDIKKIDELLKEGKSINEIAVLFNTTRQMISKYVNQHPEGDYTLGITYMYRNKPCTTIYVDFLNQKIAIKNKTDDMLHRAFGVKTNPDWNDFELFLEERCFQRTRGDIKEILKELNIDSYDTLQITEKTQGRMADDNMWLKFKYYDRGDGLNVPN